MAEDTNRLTEDQQKRAIAWLERHWKGTRNCPICGKNNWTIGEHFVAPVTITHQAGIQLGGTIYPQFSVMSDECGYTIFVNAVISGVMDKPEPSS